MTTTNVTTSTNTAGASVLSGLVSGLNTSALVAAQIAAESAPKDALQQQVATDTTLRTALQSLNAGYANLATLATADAASNAWNVFTTASSDPSVSATTTTNASAGTVSFSVDSVAAAQVDVTAPMSDSSTVPVFTIVGSTGTQVQVQPASGSVADIATAINQSSAGVSAIAVASGTDATTGAALYRLQLTSSHTGASGAFGFYGGSPSSVTAGTAPNLLTQPGAATIQTASDAAVTLWAGTSAAQTVSSTSNTFADLLPGVTVTVSKASATPVTLTIAQDNATITNAAATLVSSVNSLLQSIASSSAVTSSTDASGNVTTSGGPFTGDSLIRNASYALFNTIAQPASGASPASIGIITHQDGSITLDATKFQAALAADPSGTHAMMQSISTAVAAQATAQSDPVVGALTSRVSSLASDIGGLNSQVSAWTVELASRQATLESTFAAMESQLSALKTQSTWLSQQFPTTISSTGH
ncbi:MAG: flagellar filament capping protein FliD [Acidobacteria bacterium]|nr:flagellar filament capping protein FliD [Acidobacteriota bacterium]